MPVLVDAEFGGQPRKLLLLGQPQRFLLRARPRDRRVPRTPSRSPARPGRRASTRTGGRFPIPTPCPARKARWSIPTTTAYTNWFSPSYSPQTKLVLPERAREGRHLLPQRGGVPAGPDVPRRQQARSARRGAVGGAARARPADRRREVGIQVTTPPWCGLLSTAGGLVFSGTMEGMFFALDAESGKPLWRFQTGGEIWSNPISYQVDGHQYIAIAAGNTLIVFGLGGA